MTPYSWRPGCYRCPDCGTRTESKGGPDGLNAQRCPECGWVRSYDPNADEFPSDELDRVSTDIASTETSRSDDAEHIDDGEGSQ